MANNIPVLNKSSFIEKVQECLNIDSRISKIKELPSVVKKKYQYKCSDDIEEALLNIEDLVSQNIINNKLVNHLKIICQYLDNLAKKNKDKPIKYLHFKKFKKFFEGADIKYISLN